MSIKKIVLATSNRGKLVELKKMLDGYPVEIVGLDAFGELDPFEETGETFAQNALQKAQHYSRLLNSWVIADDSGLQVDALDDAPGVRSARFAGAEGSGRDEANNKKLLEVLRDTPREKRQAQFCCYLCLAKDDDILIEVEGFLKGIITDQPSGDNGFGYDPIFYLPQKGKTVAQLSSNEKNEISHRGRALRKLKAKLTKILESF